MIDWALYEPYVPPSRGLWSELPRTAARSSYNHWISARPQRWVQLQLLLSDTNVRLDGSDESLHRLNDWFLANMLGVAGSSGKWGVWAERWWDVAIILSPDTDGAWTTLAGPENPPTMPAFVTPEEALSDFVDPNWRYTLPESARALFLHNVRTRGTLPK